MDQKPMKNKKSEKTYEEWIVEIKDFKGGGMGCLVILVTILATGIGGWFGAVFFSEGDYPKIVLAFPGLLVGAFAFFATSGLIWVIKSDAPPYDIPPDPRAPTRPDGNPQGANPPGDSKPGSSTPEDQRPPTGT